MSAVRSPGLDDDSRLAYLFQCGASDLQAVTLDPAGTNLPTDCLAGWKLVQEFSLGVREIVPLPIAPEPIIRGIKAEGYYIWRNAPSNPRGTSQ